MDMQDLEGFVTKMCSEKVFSCALCNNLLTVPVMIVQNIGNICSDCFENESEENDWNAIPNPTLDIILNNLQLPCKYQFQGCSTRTHYECLKEHEYRCIYQTISCNLKDDGCEWKGKLMNYFNHFKEEHPKHVLNSPYGQFSFELNIEKSVNVVKMFNNKGRVHMLIIKENGEERKLLHFIRDLRFANEDLKMSVRYVGEKGEYKFHVSTTCDESNSVKILLSTVREITDSSDVKIMIKPKRCESKNVSSELLKYLECPVCKELMRPPILQCTTGHCICNSCKKRLTECPTCRQAWGTTTIRNFALEGLTPSVQYPCVYGQFGCTANFLGTEIYTHEAICDYKQYRCPASDCHFAGNYASCKNHFRLNHANQLVEGTTYQSSFTPLANRSPATTHVMFFFEHYNIYELTFKRLADSCSWYIRILNNYNRSIKYFYTIIIASSRIQQRKMLKSNLCLSKDDEAINDMIVEFTYNNLTNYKDGSSNDQIKYICEIFDKC